MTKLGVNVDHVATIREARKAPEPSPVTAALLAELAGAHGITVHLRGDRRHIQDQDVLLLRRQVTTRLNVEMAVTDEMLGFVLEVCPETVTLVPETPEEVTTEGGLDVVSHRAEIRRAVELTGAKGIATSIFIDPEKPQVDGVAEVGAACFEINTAAYSEAVPKGLDESDLEFGRQLEKLATIAEYGQSIGLRVLAGHGLTYRNVGPVSKISPIEELNIGHNIVSRAVLVGMERAVREMLQAMSA
jgi:pyridoxine 5-phosphate synthase